jgi:glycosyltransferase involved in cell wall biosynthesis
MTPVTSTSAPKYKSFQIILPTYNEEARIERVISYLMKWAPVLVIDNFSDDQTVHLVNKVSNGFVEVLQIANQGTSQTPEWFAEVVPQLHTNYFVGASCSELIPPPLFDFYNKLACDNTIHLISNPIISYTCGFNIPLWGGAIFSRPRYVQRFFHKDALDIDRIKIHQPFMVKDGYKATTVAHTKLNYTILHLRDSDWESLTRKHLGYAIVEADQRNHDHARMTKGQLIVLLLGEIARFLKVLLTKRVSFFVVFREAASRAFMHVSTYIIGVELKYSKGLDYSYAQSSKLWHGILDSTSEIK